MSADQNERGLLLKLLFWLAVVFVAVTLVWATIGRLPLWWYPLQEAALFGDSFGYVNALFSGLALGGVVVAIFLQTMELRYQRKELEESQRIWNETAQSQAATAEAQRQSLDRLKEQADALLMAGYINALVATTQRPPIGQITPEGQQAHDRVEAIAKVLDERVGSVLGTLQPRTKGEWLSEHLQRLATAFQVQWDTCEKHGGKGMNIEDSKARLEELRRELTAVFQHFDDGLMMASTNVLDQIQSLAHRSVREPTTADEEKRPARLLGRRGQN